MGINYGDLYNHVIKPIAHHASSAGHAAAHQVHQHEVVASLLAAPLAPAATVAGLGIAALKPTHHKPKPTAASSGFLGSKNPFNDPSLGRPGMSVVQTQRPAKPKPFKPKPAKPRPSAAGGHSGGSGGSGTPSGAGGASEGLPGASAGTSGKTPASPASTAVDSLQAQVDAYLNGQLMPYRQQLSDTNAQYAGNVQNATAVNTEAQKSLSDAAAGNTAAYASQDAQALAQHQAEQTQNAATIADLQSRYGTSAQTAIDRSGQALGAANAGSDALRATSRNNDAGYLARAATAIAAGDQSYRFKLQGQHTQDVNKLQSQISGIAATRPAVRADLQQKAELAAEQKAAAESEFGYKEAQLGLSQDRLTLDQQKAQASADATQQRLTAAQQKVVAAAASSDRKDLLKLYQQLTTGHDSKGHATHVNANYGTAHKQLIARFGPVQGALYAAQLMPKRTRQQGSYKYGKYLENQGLSKRQALNVVTHVFGSNDLRLLQSTL